MRISTGCDHLLGNFAGKMDEIVGITGGRRRVSEMGMVGFSTSTSELGYER
jgi:hypothetical protein